MIKSNNYNNNNDETGTTFLHLLQLLGLQLRTASIMPKKKRVKSTGRVRKCTRTRATKQGRASEKAQRIQI
jgi:hypothetical protein